MSIQTKGILLAVISAICYGTNPLGALFLYEEGLNVNSVIFYRFAFATLFLAIFMLIQKRSFFVTLKELLILIFLGLLFGISSISLFSSFLYMDAGLASTILFVYPIFVAILMAIFFKEKSSIITILSISLAIIGVLFLSGSDEANVSKIGIILVLTSSLCYAIYIVIINQYLKLTALKVTLYSMLFCTITIFIHSLFTQSSNIMPLENFSMWFYSIFLALVPTIISLLFLIKAIQIIGSTSSSILGALEPLTAVLIGVLIFNEIITFWLIIGIVLILLAVVMIILKSILEKIFFLKYK
ncbi:MAG: DMT family transporter [Aliarcobacter skirrowii]|uniref:DMT family transporter n=1 Tax=Aliarcobacter skirrowii TaxID=28200 RepID=UPI00242E339C|nr:DMT family transporter [Aliarcobacter skirrowii]MDD2508013.1 DMT family transporter [Aliarcobacter skirrowii]MDD3496299.1 DMT family transporter [Aliarcobacter skirrowii]MDX4027378.1 DMT family transporter [Aliarcobacter skirrowii]